MMSLLNDTMQLSRSQNLACDTCDIYLSLNLCLEIDINTIEREVVYLSCLFISVLFFFVCFNFLTVHHKNLP